MRTEFWLSALPWLLGSLGIVLAVVLLRRPITFFLRLLAKTGVGLCFLSIFAPIGQALGAGLGVNLFNALVLGILGVPGFGLLLLLRWALR